ncbi:SLC13 family permease [Lysobacter sp. GX 14042]|uniref:SLC13 family permease n=1 Tax=Lysobacter sp. GX 14042 TaxID=2907155 RepID=UPI001F3D2A3B|nr:SLC13 family permease [Lysobacter sp. GX 14042]MCE7032078.1 SLC13 family permease [Lysobacter sp. GX 14042]
MELWLTLAVLAGAIYLFVTEKLPVDVVALLVMASLLVLGLVSPPEALSGFSSQATITVAAMFVLSAGLQRSGALLGMGEALARIRWPWLFALVMMLVVAFVSAFVNNTAAVAVFLPLVISAAIASRKAPSRYLIPLSYAAQFGGVCTLVGTSTNLLVNSLAIQSGRAGFGLFEFAPLGVIFVGIGTAYLMLVRNFLLPDLGVPEMDTDGHGGPFMVELLVPEKSPAVGQRGRDVVPADAGPVSVLQVIRDGVVQPSRHVELQAGDRLLLRGEWSRIQALRRQLKLEHDQVARDLEGHAGAERLHAEVMVAPGSHLIGHTLAGMRFGHVYRVRVHGLQRQRAPLRQRLDHMPLAVGDILLVDSTEKALRTLRDDPGLIVLGERAQPRIDARRAWTSALVMAGVIGTAALGLLPIVASAILGCVALVVLRCLKPDEAYAAVDWKVVMLLAGVLPLGIALEHSGGASWLARNAIGLVGGMGPVACLAVVYLLSSILTEVMSNNAAAVLVVPIGIATAESLGVDAKPFLVAVAFAASTSFATPVGYQTNAMVHAAAGYRFADFIRIGMPLNLIFWIAAVVLIPRFFPF